MYSRSILPGLLAGGGWCESWQYLHPGRAILSSPICSSSQWLQRAARHVPRDTHSLGDTWPSLEKRRNSRKSETIYLYSSVIAVDISQLSQNVGQAPKCKYTLRKLFCRCAATDYSWTPDISIWRNIWWLFCVDSLVISHISRQCAGCGVRCVVTSSGFCCYK